MNRDEDMALLEFCAAQHERFEAAAWAAGGIAGVPPDTLAAAALFLADTTWYGLSGELSRVAESLSPGASFPVLVRRTRFDFARFGPMLQMRLRHACPLS
jgi:hypothetical protein